MTLLGPDVSGYQAGIDMGQVAAEGHAFVLAKVSQGSGYRSPAWVAHRDGARAHGLLLAGYHFIDTSDAAAQAANCKAALGDTTIPLALDWESGSGDWPNFCAVLDAFRGAGLNVRLAYCPRWYWQAQGSPDMSTVGLPLWSSRYVTATGAPTSIYQSVSANQWVGYGGLGVGLVQFTDKATIAGMAIDCSAFGGTRDELAALLGAPASTSVAAPTPSPHGDDPMAFVPIRVAADGTFYESFPVEAGTSSTVIDRAFITWGSAWGGTHFKVSCLDTNGGVMAGQKSGDIANNRRDWLEIPSGAVLATVEGKVASMGARPSAALVSKIR